MIDVQTKVQTILQAQWIETNPALADVVFRFDEFDPIHPRLQVLLEVFPDQKTWVVEKSYRIEQKCKLTLYLKPARYDPTNISDYKTKFFNAKTEIDRILSKNKFLIPGINNLELLQAWDDKNTVAVGRGIKQVVEPILFQSEQLLTAIYYNDAELQSIEIQYPEWGYTKLFGEIWIALEKGGYCKRLEGTIGIPFDLQDDKGGGYFNPGESGAAYSNSLAYCSGHIWVGQGILPSVTCQIDGITLKMRKHGNPSGNVVVSIRNADSNFVPTGNDLVSVSLSMDLVSNDLTEIDFLFSNAIALTANNKYCVIIRCPNGDADNYTEVGNEESGQCPCT
jgi:hypothetical protein